MISRRTAKATAAAYTARFTGRMSTGYGYQSQVLSDSLYDYLYENEYQAWFCNHSKTVHSHRALTEWFMKIHTGETLIPGTREWSWEKRKQLGQTYLRNLARDLIRWYLAEQPSMHEWTRKKHDQHYDTLVRRLELDGYVFRDGDLVEVEVDVIDVEAERGLLEQLHVALGLADRAQTFEFLTLAEDHYVAGRWSDCIGNSRKFFEAILQQVASKYAEYAVTVRGTNLGPQMLQRPAQVRQYLETEGLLEKKERAALDGIYGLLSHTGAHPYMAEKDQARLLRQVALTITQFVMLRLEGAIKSR